MARLSFDLNDYIYVQLTDAGKKILADLKRNPVEEDGWYRFQAWDLMSVFGDQMYLGNPEQPIKSGVRFSSKSFNSVSEAPSAGSEYLSNYMDAER